MGRFVGVLILLVVVFFGGLSYGSASNQVSEVTSKEDLALLIENEDIIVGVDILPYDIVETFSYEDTEKVNQTANFFETVVTGFYDMLVSTLYSFADLFFD